MRPVSGLILALVLVAAACGTGADGRSTEAPSTTETTAATTTTEAPPTGTDATTPPDGRPVTFDNADGLALEGRWFGDGSTAVVLAHMRPATMESWYPFAKVLASEGYAALAFNFRGYGASEGSGFAVDVDTIAAIDEAYRRGAERVYVIGASMGGTGAIAAAAERPVEGVGTLSAPKAFEGVDAVAAARRLTAPLLMVAAEGDDAYLDQAAEVAAAATVEVKIVPLSGRRHGTDLFAEHGDELTDLLLGFISG